MKIRRILAWIIDWNLCGIPAVMYGLVFREITENHGLNNLLALIFVFAVLLYPVLFVVRDVLFKGRSLAKRIFKLHVVDNRTNELPSKGKLILRNLFFSIYPAEAIFLIMINRSLGDMVTNTRVVRK